MTPEEPDFSQDIIERREFTLADFIAQEGADFLKGESPVPKLVQVTTEIKQFIAAHLGDSSGALQIILQLIVDEELTKVSQELLYELVHRVDVKWGQLYGERPYFQQPHQKPHPEDEYTHNSVRDKLVSLLARLEPNK